LFTKSTSGAIHTPKVIYRFVGTAIQGKNTLPEIESNKPDFAYTLSLVLSGVIVLGAGYFS
jgi:hypothetical protein